MLHPTTTLSLYARMAPIQVMGLPGFAV